MLLLLSTFNAALNPCSVRVAEFSAHENGYFCGQCQRVVHDFSQSANPVADLAAARAAAPDGRVCGQFQAAQVVGPAALTRRLRWFLVALVLVVGQGLTAQAALAQVCRPTVIRLPPKITHRNAPLTPKLLKSTPTHSHSAKPNMVYGVIAEEMPTFRGGSNRAVIQYLQQQIIWPKNKTGEIVRAEGRVLASFTVGTDGRVLDPKIVRGIHPLLDAEVLRVIRAMPNFNPGRQNGKPVAVSMVVPVTFKQE